MKTTCVIASALVLVIGGPGCSGKETPAPAQTAAPAVEPQATPEASEPAAVRSAEPGRVAAEWVLPIGGKVRILIEGRQQEVKDLADLPKGDFAIEVLDTQGQKISDADLAKLNGLNRLKALWIRDAPITGSGLAEVQGLGQLEVIGFEGSKIVDDSLQSLKGLPKLINLHLDRTPVTDAGLAHLSGTGLTVLRLSGTMVTDAGLEHLKQVKSLLSISVKGTQVTDDGVASFQAAVPGCEVIR